MVVVVVVAVAVVVIALFSRFTIGVCSTVVCSAWPVSPFCETGVNRLRPESGPLAEAATLSVATEEPPAGNRKSEREQTLQTFAEEKVFQRQ